MNDQNLPLIDLKPGEKAEVADIFTGRGHWQDHPGFGRHGHGHGHFGGEGPDYFMRLGIRKGAVIEMIGCSGHGPVTVSVEGERFALGRGLAMKVMVKRI
jgi:ferrous iron transport protein A